jgi:hypothetical protein
MLNKVLRNLAKCLLDIGSGIRYLTFRSEPATSQTFYRPIETNRLKKAATPQDLIWNLAP